MAQDEQRAAVMVSARPEVGNISGEEATMGKVPTFDQVAEEGVMRVAKDGGVMSREAASGASPFATVRVKVYHDVEGYCAVSMLVRGVPSLGASLAEFLVAAYAGRYRGLDFLAPELVAHYVAHPLAECAFTTAGARGAGDDYEITEFDNGLWIEIRRDGRTVWSGRVEDYAAEATTDDEGGGA